MSSTNIAKLERLPLREVWKHEAYDFTQWLEENFDVLNSSLNLNLVSVDREQSAGSGGKSACRGKMRVAARVG